jgi:hypothetical protein
MRIGQGLSSLDLYRLFTEHIERQRTVEPVQKQQRQQSDPSQLPKLTFKFLDSFETSNNGAKQFAVRREIGEIGGKPRSATGVDRTTRTLSFDRSSFEPSRVAPVDLGQTRSTVNRNYGALNPTQSNGFLASVDDFS